MRGIPGGVTAALGFRASGISSGIKPSGEPDLALVATGAPAAAAGVFTENLVRAAPVLVSQSRLRKGSARAVLINSGCANCLTGAVGIRDARRLSRAVARELGIAEDEILVASTGIIGRRLPVPQVERALPRLVKQLSRAHHAAAAQAILTTDLRVKEAAVETAIQGRPCRIGGMAKGAGMIAPSMATMLCVITTDVAVAPGLLRRLLAQAVARTFNRISVDGDMSTNDTVFALASGRSGVSVREGSRGARAFGQALQAVAGRLATLLIKDGEGAGKIAKIRVAGGRTDREAQACARRVAESLLVKTMLAGGDPNVGRIAAAVGASGARFDPRRLDVLIGAERIISRGAARRLGTAAMRKLLAAPDVQIGIHLHAGRGEGRMMTCDLTEEYVRINARYST
ncbi:MAG: bifunctional glutamate N-acetyltransferase/amino-acid acetyltransferase ArgJ [Candidatus Omnitrophica bacterium]|nr:bifunctional glutamate N-acetyltransferase/amino-acid acetyltransferase ArgJ [Candidatus Omnitrophota bacterium]